MKNKHIAAIFLIFIFTAYFSNKLLNFDRDKISASIINHNQGEKEYSRIISMAPSITEILFALGLGEKVVGVTKFCEYPPEAKSRKEIGGYVDPNYEAVILLKPDLIITLEGHEKARKHFLELNLKTLTVNHKGIEEILNSIMTIGKANSIHNRAKELINDIRKKTKRIEKRTAGLDRPKVLVCIGRNMGSGSLSDVYIAGKDGFYSKMITLTGGVNAYKDGNVKYPMVTAEGILQMDPQIIIDMIPKMQEKGWTEEEIRNEWRNAGNIAAVRNNRIYIISDDFSVIPGPRFVQIIEKMAMLIHPEINWEQ